MGIIQYEPGEAVEYPSEILEKKDCRIIVEDFWIRRYNSGHYFSRYLYSNLIDVWIKEMRAYHENRYDNIVLVTGSEGVGKSTTAINIARKYDPDFSLENVAYNLEDVLNIILKAKHGEVIILDEAEELVDRQQHNTYENQTMKKILILGRSLGFVFLILIPENQIVMPYVLRRCRYHAHVEELAWTIDDEKKRGYFRLSRYKRYENETKEIQIGYATSPILENKTESKYLEKKEGAFYDFINDRKLEYIARREKKLNSGRGPGRPAEDPERFFRWLERFEGGESAKDIAEAEGLAASTVYCGLSKARKARKALEE